MKQEELGRYWKTIMETMADGLMVVDTNGVIVAANPALEEMSGFGRSELVGQLCTVLQCDSCDGVRCTEGEKYCALFVDGVVRGWHCILRRKDGSPLKVMKNARVFTDPEGTVIGGVETITDLEAVEERDRLIRRLKQELYEREGFGGILGRSAAMKRVFELVAQVAESSAPVVITGESGTGKELVARAIHQMGRRSKKPFIAVNCAALNENVLESELFGHVKGAFTGADRMRVGRFEAAHEGTLFLDEIGDVPPGTQVKLLRALQEREIERVGDHRPIPVDTRVISASNKDLNLLMAKGRFREDLYYRIGTVAIRLPPLRERTEDIPLLVQAFVSRMQIKTGKSITGVEKNAMDALLRHSWPGNVRELVNAIDYCFIVCSSGEITMDHLPPEIVLEAESRGGAVPGRHVHPSANNADYILETLRLSGGNKSEAARRLGISRVTLWKRLREIQGGE